MIRLLSRLVKWLEVRFPAKVVVLESDYENLNYRLLVAEQSLKAHNEAAVTQEQNMAALIDRMDRVEATAVHKEAVKDLVQVVQLMKEDLAGFKTSLGFRAPAQNEELTAMLNGEFIGGSHNG